MARPTVVVRITSAPPPRSIASPTGLAIMGWYGGKLAAPSVLRVTSADQVISVYNANSDGTVDGPTQTLANYVADCLANGAPAVILARPVATTAAPNAPITLPPDAAAWTAVLAQVTEEYGAVAQVAIPGIVTAAARDALAAHTAAFASRTAFMDAAADATASDLTTLVTGYNAQAGSPRITIAAPWVTVQGPGSTTRDVPASVVMMGRVAAGDAVVGHTNHAPAGDQKGRGAGVIVGGVNVKTTFTTAQLDALDDAGVSVIRMVSGRPTIMGWVSVSSDQTFHQLNVGRFIGQCAAGIRAIGRQFLFVPLDAGTFADFETAIRAFFMPLRASRALWTGFDGSKDGYDVAVAAVNTPETIAARLLVSASIISITPYAHDVELRLATSVAQEVPAA